MPSDPPHAVRHSTLDYVLRAHIKETYESAVGMLTRTGPGTDIAPDASVFAKAPDPVTGGRRLEELAFEVTSEQSISTPTEKARELIRRGVRRVFCILVKQNRLMEWSRETDGWATMPVNEAIEDACFVRPLPAAALLESVSADDAVVLALRAKENKILKRWVEEGEARGLERGRAEGVAWTLCENFEIPLNAERREAIERMNLLELEELIATVRATKAWPEPVR